MLRNLARSALHASDIHTTLAPRDDAGLIAELREPRAMDFPNLLAQLETLPLPPAQLRRCGRLVRAIERDLSALHTGVSCGRRMLPWAAAMVLVNLPLAIPFYTGQRKFSSLQVAARAKDLMLLMGLLTRDTSTPHAFRRHVENRVFLDLAGSALYAGPAFIPAARHLMSDPRFNIPVTVAIAVSALLYFNRQMLPNAARTLGAHLRIEAINHPPPQCDEAAHREIHAWAEALVAEKNRLEASVRAYRHHDSPNHSPRALSDNLNRLLNQLDGSFKQLADELLAYAPQQASPHALSHTNPDVFPKLVVALFSLMIAGSLGAFLYQEISALVDLCARGVWIFSELAKAAADSSVNLQGILQNFKEISGLAMLLLGYLSANQSLGFLQADTPRFWIGTAALSAANLTLPGPVATVVSRGLGKVLETCHGTPRPAPAAAQDAVAAPAAVDTIATPPNLPHSTPS